MLRTIIIDDEPNARQVVKNILELYCNNVEVVGEAENVTNAITIINKLKPELVLLDIRMPDGTGFDILKKVDVLDFHFVFITAYEQYAIKAIKLSALDYILKPINTNELINTIEKAQLSSLSVNDQKTKLDTFVNNQSTNKTNQKLVLNTHDSIYIVNVKDIITCKADKNYTEVNLSDKRKLVISQTLKNFENMLTTLGFFRVHQSYLINLKYISYYEKGLGGTIIMNDGSRIPVSSRRKNCFLQIMTKI